MPAPKKNAFWKFRSKHGRNKLFDSPQLLWEEACKYFEWCCDNPLEKSIPVKAGPEFGKSVRVELERPFTLVGLCSYLGCSENYFRNFKSNNKSAEGFMAVIDQIKQIIEVQQFERAAVGIFNANIISRMLGLVDKKEVKKESIKKLAIVRKDGEGNYTAQEL